MARQPSGLWLVTVIALLLIAAGGRGAVAEGSISTPVKEDKSATAKDLPHNKVDAKSADEIEMPEKAAKPAEWGTAKRAKKADAAAPPSLETCGAAVEEYLRHINEGAQDIRVALRNAREAYSHARLHSPNKVKAAKAAFDAVKQDAARFEEAAVRKFGGKVPAACIAEVQRYVDSLPDISDKGDYTRTYTHFYRLLDAHVRTVYNVLKGILHYHRRRASTPLASMFNNYKQFFDDKAAALNRELKATAEGKHGAAARGPAAAVTRLGKALLAKLYASSSYFYYAVAGVGIMLIGPLLFLYFFFAQGIYTVFYKLFILFHHFGLTSSSTMKTPLRRFGGHLRAMQWNAVANDMLDGLLAFASGSSTSYYNGILMLFVLACIAAVATIVVWRWTTFCWSCLFCQRRRRPAVRQLHPTTTTATGAAARQKRE